MNWIHLGVEVWGAVTGILTVLAGLVRTLGIADSRPGKVITTLAVDFAAVKASMAPPPPPKEEASK